jgi:hypothetical protein
MCVLNPWADLPVEDWLDAIERVKAGDPTVKTLTNYQSGV